MPLAISYADPASKRSPQALQASLALPRDSVIRHIAIAWFLSRVQCPHDAQNKASLYATYRHTDQPATVRRATDAAWIYPALIIRNDSDICSRDNLSLLPGRSPA